MNDLALMVFAMVDVYQTEDRKKKFIECHKKFIDVHVMLRGSEKIGIVNKELCIVSRPYNKKKDFEKLEGPLDFITLKKGQFALFFPSDGHMPGLKIKRGASSSIKKIVFKMPVINKSK